MKNNPHSVDRYYKFCLKRLGIIFYIFFFHYGSIIEFMETENPQTGQRKDATLKIDGKKIHILEFLATVLSDEKLKDIFDYWGSIFFDPEYKDYTLACDIISIAKPGDEIREIKIGENVIFRIRTFFIKKMDGAKILKTLIYKTIMYEELTDFEAICLLVLPDMNIDIPIKQLLNMICFIYGNANIPDIGFKIKIYSCLIMLFKRFYKDDELQEMIDMLRTANQDPKIAEIVEKYGWGFDELYLNGMEDGAIKNARNLLANGVDINIISDSLGISIEELEKIKRKL